MARFVLTDETVNCYGFRTITKGVDLKSFLKNPIMLFMHMRGMVIGKWEDVKVSKEDANVTAEAVFDLTDPFAAGIASKVDQQMLNACSAGLGPMEWSEKPEVLVAGQTRPTLTKSILNETSIVDIPGNKGALRLKLGDGLWLTEDAAANADTLNKLLPTLTLKTAERMDEILLALGLAAGSTPAQVVAAINQIKLSAATTNADTIISLAEQVGLVDASNKDKFVTLAKTSPELCLQFLDFASVKKAETPVAPVAPAAPTVTLAAVLKDVNSQNQNPSLQLSDERAKWTMRDWEKKDS
ncbi:MAG TPA: HK97 family phage prohead protease, partial [Hymenobacter sp.]